MIKQLEMTGKNKDEAISRALAQLGMDRDDVSVEILELGKTGFLGIGSVPAKVRVTYEVPDEPRGSDLPPVGRGDLGAPDIISQPPVEQKPARAPKAERRPSKPRKEPRPVSAPQTPTSHAPQTSQVSQVSQASQAPQTPQASQARQVPVRPVSETQAESVSSEGAEEKIQAFLTGLLEHMEVSATPHITRDGDTYDVVLEGENLGSLIGRRGETLDAIQQLTGYAVNKNRSKRVRIHMDAENYRARREESLRRLATKVAGKVLRYHRSVTLEPMNAYERHVIHAALQDYRGVTTHSVGVEPNRRVVVSCDMEK